MQPYSPVEILVVTDQRDDSPVAAFIRMTEIHWAKPGALLMDSLEIIERDCSEHHKMKRYVLDPK